MRRLAVAALLLGSLGLAACGSSGGTNGTNSSPGSTAPSGVPMGNGNPITGPIDRSRAVMNRQNQQLYQEDQRTGSNDPTTP
jgi:hypothetical protein